MILVTGANGQVGWEIARRGAGVRAYGHGDLDITDGEAVRRIFDNVRPQVVVNAAAYTAVDKAESDRTLAFAVNEAGPRNLALACAAFGIPLIHISTDYVFDGAKAGPYTENDPVAPLGVYGASKLAGEQAIREIHDRAVILRTAWVYGVHGANFVKTMLRLGAEREALRVVDDQRGCPTAAADLASAILVLAKKLTGTVEKSAFGTFHCVGGGETTWCGFARGIFEAAQSRLPKTPRIEPITTADYPTPARRPANSVLDCSKLQAVHGITLPPWPTALREMLAEILPA
jgi:dTDP-4-dehydrorhamnose reductase